MIEIEVDTRAVTNALNNLSKSIDDMTPVFKTIGEHIESEIANNFRDETDPYGRDWKPLSPFTIEKRRKGPRPGKDQILNDTGNLKNSFSFNAETDQVEVGTTTNYAPLHQYGGHGDYGFVPPRPFLPVEEKGLPQEWQQDILGYINKYIERSVK